jgi:hypothetical protein
MKIKQTLKAIIRENVFPEEGQWLASARQPGSG